MSACLHALLYVVLYNLVVLCFMWPMCTSCVVLNVILWIYGNVLFPVYCITCTFKITIKDPPKNNTSVGVF